MPEDFYSYRTDVAKLLEGFQQGVFQRNVSMDGEPGWAIKILPYIAAMGRLARGEYPPDGPGMPPEANELAVMTRDARRWAALIFLDPMDIVTVAMGAPNATEMVAKLEERADRFIEKARSTYATGETR